MLIEIIAMINIGTISYLFVDIDM